MTIEQADKIDGLGIDKEANELVLLISDHLPWNDEDAHLRALESKLGSYVEFLGSGQHLESVPNSRNMPVRIRLVHEYTPTESGKRFLRAVELQLVESGIRFSFGSLPTEY